MVRGCLWGLVIGALTALGCDEAAGPDDAGRVADGDAGQVSEAGLTPGEDAGVSLEPGQVMTEFGPVQGVEEDGLQVFRGIPFAAPPTGALRFQPPEPPEPWTEVLDASEFGPLCPQRPRMSTSVAGDEDCLQLNVWAPPEPGPHPVMVWIHGGAYIQGTATLSLYDGAPLASAGPVVVVTLNYRLGTLGFLALEALADEDADGSAGNYGLRDQIAALEWVRRNIAAFGGDPDEVTVFGESAGGGSICALMGMPEADELFDRAVIQSGGGCYGWPNLSEPNLYAATPADDIGRQIADAAGCSGSTDAEMLECLRAAPAADLVMAQFSAGSGALGLPPIGPVVDGVSLPAWTYDRIRDGLAPDRPVVIGSNADESRTFLTGVMIADEAAYQGIVRTRFPTIADDVLAIYPASSFASPKAAYEALVSDVGFICPTLSFAAMAQDGQPVFLYHYTHRLSGRAAALGAVHGAELFGLFDGWDEIPGYTAVDADFRVGEGLRQQWLSFARAGRPDSTWAEYPVIRVLEDPPRDADAIRDGRCDALRTIGLVR